MKIDIELDVTPEELRTFLGLPDVKPIQDEMLAALRERLLAGSEDLDPVRMMQPFLTPNVGAMEAMQRAFWQAFSAGAAGSTGDSRKPAGTK
ncbi:MAG: hypothetical protein H6983_05050 [Ectothiorhodospiraceae bacterium]|nr:hypothetical protein [Ectothiorhodospiraceae bacterium]